MQCSECSALIDINRGTEYGTCSMDWQEKKFTNLCDYGYPCSDPECYERGNWHRGCEMCPEFNK